MARQQSYIGLLNHADSSNDQQTNFHSFGHRLRYGVAWPQHDRRSPSRTGLPFAPGALVNMGTILFRQNKYRKAKELYARAVEADPAYPLAHFNLGNLADELGESEDARKHYLEAIRLNPRYADAYFNLALLSERTSDILRAIGYWSTYLKLDATSSWARAARKQLDKLKQSVRTK